MNNYVGRADTVIVADGVGYYDYLPSIFIHKDFNRSLAKVDSDSLIYQRINKIDVYAKWRNSKVNRYPAGVALLQMPFFLITKAQHQNDENISGYEPFFQKMVFVAAVFYLILGLVFMLKVFDIYRFKKILGVFLAFFALLATSLAYYAQMESSFSHVYSFFAINAFVFFVLKYFRNGESKFFLLACVSLGLIFLIRPVNLLIIAFLPFLAEGLNSLKESLIRTFHKPLVLSTGLLLFFSVAFIQFFLYFIQTGDFFVYSYTGYGFDFLNPHFFDILFSFKKGLFVYTPILLFIFPALFYFFAKRKVNIALFWLLGFGFLTYVFSSWESWFYGCSYGLRVYIDYYLLFFIPIGIWLNSQKIWVYLASLIVSSFFVYVNMVQLYQYQHYILHWDSMDKLGYKKVFLKTDTAFKGLLWKFEIVPELFDIAKRFEISDLTVSENDNQLLLSVSASEIPNFSNLKFFRLELDNSFDEDDPTKLVFSIQDADNNSVFWFSLYLIHLSVDDFGKHQRGYYNFDMQNIELKADYKIHVSVDTDNYPSHLSNVHLIFLSSKTAIQ
ncbi:MAG: hypothetical protein JXR34_04170 [Bacteroidales bacterium]|nr:hypothetical protein [Bacteroidales bacterium]